MAKKERIPLQYSDDLESVDAELAAAMDMLDQANDRVDGLLKTIDIPVPPQTTEVADTDAPSLEAAARSTDVKSGEEANPDGSNAE